jgi:hypothetical protein
MKTGPLGNEFWMLILILIIAVTASGVSGNAVGLSVAGGWTAKLSDACPGLLIIYKKR